MDKRKQSGFTLAELLIAVAIVVVLAGVAFVAVPNYLRSMTQLEYDAAAKEIFIAAQNHLTLAQSQGYPGLTQSEDWHNDMEFGQADTNTSADRYSDGDYHVIVNNQSGGGIIPADASGILNLMLPQGAIEGTYGGGNYIIRYNKDTGIVKDVFYSGTSDTAGFNRSGRYGYAFLEEDYEALVPAMCNDSHKNGYKEKVIGWYGGAEATNLEEITIKAPTIEVVNAEKLKVIVTDNDWENAAKNGLKLRLTVTGKLSKKTKVFTDLEIKNVTVPSTTNQYEIVLDDVTTNDSHFSQICKDLYPGEDIEIEAMCFSTSKLAPIVSSGKRTTNSLFGDGTEFGDKEDSKNTITGANIANIRHLENINPDISGIKTVADTASPVTLSAAKQSVNLNWQDFTKAIDSVNAEGVKVLPLSGTSNSPYYPVDPKKAITYDGQSHSITGVIVTQTSGNAGLFGELKGGTEIKNLELVDFKINGGNAGALAGLLSGDSDTKITNVLAHNTRGTNGNNDAAYEIKGSGATGGLIGSMTGGKVEYSAAAVYVNGGGATGGLIGSMSGGEVKSSYSGGHTVNGKYKTDTIANAEGRVNVISTGGAAGGLIGSMGGGSSVANSYSTCSVSGTTAAGGFAGSAAGTITNSYCTGLVMGDADMDIMSSDGKSISTPGTKHAFVGNGGATVTGSYYYSIVNDNHYAPLSTGKTVPIALASGCAAKPFDEADGSKSAVELFSEFAHNTNPDANPSPDGAEPYDALLAAHYHGKYFFKSIHDLDDSASGFVRIHYGDWPEEETYVFNG